MPRFRTTEPPEQSSSGFVGRAIFAAMLVLTAILFLRGDLTENRRMPAKVFLPTVDKPLSE